jgi:hypothetical protein
MFYRSAWFATNSSSGTIRIVIPPSILLRNEILNKMGDMAVVLTIPYVNKSVSMASVTPVALKIINLSASDMSLLFNSFYNTTKGNILYSIPTASTFISSISSSSINAILKSNLATLLELNPNAFKVSKNSTPFEVLSSLSAIPAYYKSPDLRIYPKYNFVSIFRTFNLDVIEDSKPKLSLYSNDKSAVSGTVTSSAFVSGPSSLQAIDYSGNVPNYPITTDFRAVPTSIPPAYVFSPVSIQVNNESLDTSLDLHRSSIVVPSLLSLQVNKNLVEDFADYPNNINESKLSYRVSAGTNPEELSLNSKNVIFDTFTSFSSKTVSLSVQSAIKKAPDLTVTKPSLIFSI